MRVIAGSASGLRLHAPAENIRPTMDRVRAAVFSSLGERTVGASVLDLFAGSGAYGIEALSRGASQAVFVDHHRAARKHIERNLSATHLQGTIVIQDALKFIERASGDRYDLIFADPPYAKAAGVPDYTAQLLESAELPDRLVPDGRFILEKWAPLALPETERWEIVKRKRYGQSEIVYLSPRS